MFFLIKNSYQISVVLCLFILMSCEKEEFYELDTLKTGSVFFDDTSNILWRHRVNTIEELRKYSEIFKGIEFDVLYYPDRNEFDVEHDIDTNSNLTLVDYFNAIPMPENNYYWIDIKNLNNENIDLLLSRMLDVLRMFNLKENVICESWNATPLAKMNLKGIYTSYWIPSFTYDGQLSSDQLDILEKINSNLEYCKHNAISAPYQMLPFINDYLSDCTTHLWTNGLHQESDKEQILEMTKKENVKIVLIDYEEPFNQTIK